MKFYAVILFFISRRVVLKTSASILNQTGGSFPDGVYQLASFSDGLVEPAVAISYFGPSSSVGKCNIMGYWHTGNTDRSGSYIPTQKKIRDRLICTDSCTLQSCGYEPNRSGSITLDGKTYDGLTFKNDAESRLPLTDIGATDGNLSPTDYLNFPDLQMLPALAGAVVPIYNIPELNSLNASYTMILSRSSLVNIFMGFITSWNDPRLIADNAKSPAVQAALRLTRASINIAVRMDSSGTSEVFSAALGAMSPKGYGISPLGLTASVDTSYYSQATPKGPTSTPFWCGPLTDEVQHITVKGCNSDLTISSRTFQLQMMDRFFVPQNVTLLCDASNAVIRSTILAATSLDVHVAVKTTSAVGDPLIIQIEIGYWGLEQQGVNMNKPSILSHASELDTAVTVFQEGGYVNSVGACAMRMVTSQIMTLWIQANEDFSFSLSWTVSGVVYTSSTLSVTTGTDMSPLVTAAINAVSGGSVRSISKVVHPSWTEYRIAFTGSTGSSFESLTSVGTAGSAFVTEYISYDNYPCFYGTKPERLDGSGKYTCFRRQQNFVAWSYYAGDSNPGLVAEVTSRPYTIGYTILETLQGQYLDLQVARITNKAGTVVSASSDSVGYAVMNLGGNFNSLMQANLADGDATHAWPVVGYTYFVIRKSHHIAPKDCARRTAAIEYLYRFYRSRTVKIAAESLGFATVPDFVANSILDYLVDNAMCMSGEYALSSYRVTPSLIMSSPVLSHITKDYIISYTSVDPSANIAYKTTSDTPTMWAEYAANPSAVSGIFSFFPDGASKIEKYNIRGVITTAFAHVALLPAYRLSTYDARTKVPLQVTAEIIGGIISGTISVWNDTLIQAANPLTSSFLPNIPINVVVRPVSCDANAMLVHYLKKSSSTFKRRYASTNSTADYDFKYSLLIPSSRLTYATSNSEVDLFTSSIEGSFGCYWLKRKMNTLSSVANFCHDPLCASGAVDPKQEASVLACQTNATQINPSEYLRTYDFTTSLNAGCYPLLGTVDYSILGTTNPLTCRDNGTHDANVLKNRMKFGSWLYSSGVLIKPLADNNVYATSASDRSLSLKSICDVRCNDIVYGYQYCGFVDCTWARGDFIQTVHRCDPNTQSMSVTYSLKPGRVCILNPKTSPVSGSEIPCSNVMGSYRYGKIASGLSILGMSVTALIMLLVFLNRHDKIIKKSQPIFIYIFIAGAFMMNLSILAFIGPNSDASCLLRPWCVNLTSTIMFTPLLAKLHRIEVLFRMSKKMKKTRISDLTVALQVLGLVFVDILILLLWTFIQRPKVVYTMLSERYLEVDVEVNSCSTGLDSPFEQLMVVWKSILLAAGVYKSICNWDKPSDIAEVKHFFLAIYNVSVVGGAMYFFSLFASEKQGDKMILRCIGLFISATLPVLIIVIPKFTDLQIKKFVGENIYDGSKGDANSEVLKQSKISVGYNANLRSQSMRVLPDASTPDINNSSLRCHTPSKSLLDHNHEINI